MTITMTSKDALKDKIAGAGEPDWFRDLRVRALDEAHYPSLPNRDTESWRKVDLGGLNLEEFGLAASETSLEHEGAGGGTRVLGWKDALNDSEIAGAIRATTERRLGNENASPLERLALALSSGGCVVHAKGSEGETVVIRHGLAEGKAAQPRLLIQVAPGSELTVVEEFQGHDHEDMGMWNSITDAVVGDNARLNYIAVRRFTNSEYHFTHFDAEAGRDARVHVSVVNLGGAIGKSFYTGRMTGPGGEYRGIGLNAGAGREFHDMEMLVEHFASHTISSLYYKAVQNDRAHSVFNGNLHIEPGLKGADSHQTNNNILLSRRARAESIPNLIIKAEDVSAEHGATVGRLDEEAVFYLMSRGVPREGARNLLIEGFINQVVEEIPLADRHEEINLSVKKHVSLGAEGSL